MKRYGHIWDDFASPESAEAAIYNAVKHKRQSMAVRRMLGYTDKQIRANPDLQYQLDPAKVHTIAAKISEMLNSGAWEQSAYKHMSIYNPSSGKTREIDCPSLLDHIIHWMLVTALHEPLTRGMYKYCCGSVPGRGIDYARKAVEKWVREEKSTYFVKLDIRKFYQNVDHEKLKASFRRTIKDERMLSVTDSVVDSLSRGLAIGSYTSPWFANYYLQPLDHFIMQDNYKTRRGKRVNSVRHYLRYMDDMLLIGSSKRGLEKTVRAVIAYARDNLGLEIKTSWEIRRIGGRDGTCVDIVGYRFNKDATVARKRIFLHTKRLIKRISKAYRICGYIALQQAQAAVSLLGWFSHTDNKHFTRLYIDPYISVNKIKEVISNENIKHLAPA